MITVIAGETQKKIPDFHQVFFLFDCER